MKVRVVRSIASLPERTSELLGNLLEMSDYVAKKTRIQPEVFRVRTAAHSAPDIKVAMDYPSLADYEKLFLEGLLYDKEYLLGAEKLVDMIQREPSDELFVHMDRNDYFMNLKNPREIEKKGAAAGKRTNGDRPRRYRLSRHIDVQKGKLREFMQRNFNFLDEVEPRTDLFDVSFLCTRFTAERIGCGKTEFDFDENCPMCERVFLKHDEVVRASNLTDGPPVDELLVRVTPQDLNFDVKALTH